ncbi:unnamed protein product [Moneuplotes crassus]|uniref:Uncharacterized protein n=1 Tax=Euplotes crassus TaxID=5936 RepID=A0AAD2DAW8_EUPCR|nr:unnamed protein product [Moneuplotes crassus]
MMWRCQNCRDGCLLDFCNNLLPNSPCKAELDMSGFMNLLSRDFPRSPFTFKKAEFISMSHITLIPSHIESFCS